MGDSAIVVINALFYAEVAVGFASVEALEEALPPALFRREQSPYEADSLAGYADLRYRGPVASGVHRCRPSLWALLPQSLATGS